MELYLYKTAEDAMRNDGKTGLVPGENPVLASESTARGITILQITGTFSAVLPHGHGLKPGDYVEWQSQRLIAQRVVGNEVIFTTPILMPDHFRNWIQSMSEQQRFERFSGGGELLFTESDLRAVWNMRGDLDAGIARQKAESIDSWETHGADRYVDEVEEAIRALDSDGRIPSEVTDGDTDTHSSV